MPLSRLILIRHGEAESRAASGRDFDRALSGTGHAEARATGRRLAEAGIAPELALVSSARRAVETWDESAAALPSTRVELRPEIYEASASDLLDLAETAGAGAVALVGHNPSMHALAMELVARGDAAPAVARQLGVGFPTGAAAVFRFQDGRPFAESLFSPRDGAGL